MAKNKVHRKVKVSGKSRKGMTRPARKPAITRFSDGAATKAQISQGSTARAQVRVQVKISKPNEQNQSKKQAQPKSPVKKFDMAPVNAEMKRRAERREKQPEFSEQPVISAREIKEQEIAKVISATTRSFSQEKRHRRHYRKMGFGFRRVVLAMACAAVAVFAIVYFVNVNSPDISMKVAAMQTGIDAHYPNYVPRDYNLSDITSENGKITLNFRNDTTGDAFSLIEEKSDWNTNMLLNEFVRPNFGDNYTVVSDNGFNIYISNGNAAWVNDGIFYRIVVKAGILTKKQISTIAAKL